MKSNPFLSFSFSWLENLGKRLPRTFSISVGYFPNMIGSKNLHYNKVFYSGGVEQWTIEKAIIKGELSSIPIEAECSCSFGSQFVSCWITHWFKPLMLKTIPILPFCSVYCFIHKVQIEIDQIIGFSKFFCLFVRCYHGFFIVCLKDT